jgi:putative lipoic acid-binding regulatory protein
MSDQAPTVLIEYPSVYTFKVMGRAEGFREAVLALFHRALGQEISPDSVHEQPSSAGKYVSLSISVYLLSEDQRVRVYGALHQEKRVLYYL